MKFDKLVGLLKKAEMERAEDNPNPAKGIAFAANNEDVRVQKLEEHVGMAKNLNNMLKRLDKILSQYNYFSLV